MNEAKIAVFISGRGTNMEALLKAEKEGNLSGNIELILSNNPDALGLEKAKKYGKKTIVIDHREFGSREEHEKAILKTLKKHGITHIVLAGYMRILTPFLINNFKEKIINIHPSLLPSFPGLHAQKQALEYGVKYSGCTVHFVWETVDAGPILVQKVVPVYDEDTEETLAQRILEQEHIAIVEATNIMVEKKYEINGRRVILKKHEVIDEESQNKITGTNRINHGNTVSSDSPPKKQPDNKIISHYISSSQSNSEVSGGN